jgi:hypothetical protein
MKRARYFVLFVCLASGLAAAQTRIYQHGTVTKMRMSECLAASNRVLSALSGMPQQYVAEICPEYTLVSDQVVYKVVGKTSTHLIPLAERIDFRLQKNEMVVLLDDDARQETRFMVREMSLRTDWEQSEMQQKRDALTHGHRGPTLPRISAEPAGFNSLQLVQKR